MRKTLLLMMLVALAAVNAQAEVLWEGSQVIDWGNSGFLPIGKEKFSTMKAGDQLVFGITFTGGTDWPQIQLTKGDWSGTVGGAANTPVAEGMTEVKYTVLNDMLADLQAGGVIVTGIGFTLTKVERVEGDGGDYSRAVWVGEVTMPGNWSAYQEIGPSCFKNASVGQLLRIKFKDVKSGAYLSLRNPVTGWPDLSCTSMVAIAGTFYQYTITADMLSELQANGVVVAGINYTLTAVEVWNAADYKPLQVTVPVVNNWVFENGTPPLFKATVKNPYGDNVTTSLKLVLSTDKMEMLQTVNVDQWTIKANSSEPFELEWNPAPPPGIYHAAILVGDELARSFFFAVDPTQIVSPPDAQSDFDSYWAAAKEQLAQVPVNATLTEIPSRSGAKRKVYLVEMQSVADGLSGAPVTIRGYYAEPTDGKRHPVLMHFQGYDSEYRPGGDSTTPWCLDTRYDTDEAAQYAEFILSNRGQSVNNRPASGRADGIDRDFTNTYGDWFAYQFGNKDSYYYRGAYMDCLRALDFMASRETSDMGNLFAAGESQGGAFTVAAAALSERPFKAIAPAITFMGDFPDYFQLAGWPASVAYASMGSMSYEDLLAFMSYYDTKNLAPSITCPYITSIGLQDNVCPPHTNLAPYNNARTPAADKQVVFNAELQHATNSDWNATYMAFFKKYQTESTGISTVTVADRQPYAVYDLQGRRLDGSKSQVSGFRIQDSSSRLNKGVYIVNGRKVLY